MDQTDSVTPPEAEELPPLPARERARVLLEEAEALTGRGQLGAAAVKAQLAQGWATLALSESHAP